MKIVAFKADQKYQKRLDCLKRELSLDQSAIIRIALDELYDKVLKPKKKPGEWALVSGDDYRIIIQDRENSRKLMNDLGLTLRTLSKMMHAITVGVTREVIKHREKLEIPPDEEMKNYVKRLIEYQAENDEPEEGEANDEKK